MRKLLVSLGLVVALAGCASSQDWTATPTHNPKHPRHDVPKCFVVSWEEANEHFGGWHTSSWPLGLYCLTESAAQ